MSLVLATGVGSNGYALAAEPYPLKPVRIIVAFPPGGFVDLGARVVAGPLGAALGQQVVADNRGGAGGIVGTELAARATPSPLAPQEFTAFVKSKVEKWAKVVSATGMTAE